MYTSTTKFKNAQVTVTAVCSNCNQEVTVTVDFNQVWTNSNSSEYGVEVQTFVDFTCPNCNVNTDVQVK